MTNVVPFHNPYGPAPHQTGSSEFLTTTLRAVLATPEAVVFSADHGAETKPVPWHPPAVITAAMQRDAVHALGALKARARPANQTEAERFVAALANLCAGKDLPPEAKLMGAVSGILRAGYPAAIITDPDALDRVLKRIAAPGRPTWWPSWPEFADALDAERALLRDLWSRLEVIAQGKGRAARLGVRGRADADPPPLPTDEQRARVRGLLAAAGINLKSTERHA